MHLQNIKKAPMVKLGEDLKVAERKCVTTAIDHARAVAAALEEPADYESAISLAQRMHVEIIKASDAAQLRARYGSDTSGTPKEGA